MRIGRVIAGYRKAERYGVREIAKEIGVSAATLNRIENGNPCNSDQLAKIMVWLFTKDTAP